MGTNKKHNQSLNSTIQPLLHAEKKAARQKQARELSASAQRQGYLLSSNIPEAVKNNFRHWCKQQGNPFIIVKSAKKSMVTIIADVSTVSKAFESQGKLFPGALQPSFVLSIYLHERLMQIVATYTIQSDVQSQQAVSFTYGTPIVTLEYVAQENIEVAIEELMKLWIDARIEYEAQLDIQRAAYIIKRDTPPPDPYWLATIKSIRAQNEPSDNTDSTEEPIAISEELVSRLTKEHLCEFLSLPPRSRVAKAELVQQLLTRCSGNKATTKQFFEVFAHDLALEPWELEKELECTPTERKRWTEEERLPILTARYFRKGGRDIEYSIYDRRTLFSLSTREKMEQWRTEHQAHIHENRKAGAKVAAETRRATNERLSKWGPLF